MMRYQHYLATVEFDDEAHVFHGEVINVRDVITFQGTSVKELRHAFKASVEDYLEFCAQRGEKPDKPFPGQFVIRLSPQQHRKVFLASRRAGKSVNAWATEQLVHAAED
jgi:predicted HicB family RNase H-like nuclease